MAPSPAGNNLFKPAAAQAQAELVFGRMQQCATRLSKSLSPQNVHQFRTNSRRIEALVGQLTPESRNRNKLLKLLSKLRKKAGKLRDLDVQIAFLRESKLPDRQNHRAQLLDTLQAEHERRSRKLAKAADPVTLQELRKRLRREEKELRLDGMDPLRLAEAMLPKLGHVPLTEKTLHAFRIAAKRSRYLAELAGDAPEAQAFIEELRRAQDAVGEWHDMLKLKERAEKRFGSAADSALVSFLQNISRARFRTAGHALTHALTTLAQGEAARSTPPTHRKSIESESTLGRAAAVA
jgi:CHAD domain-containing protein